MSDESSSNDDRRTQRKPPRLKIAGRLSAADSIVLLTHDRPDGDGLGSMVALALAARAQGKRARIVCAEPVPRRYAFLTADEDLIAPADLAAAAAGCDCVVVLDTCTTTQLESVADALHAAGDKVLVIDHHQTPGDIVAACWRDPSAAAVGVMVAELMEELGWPIDLPIARAVMTAVCFDTGWLRFANTDGRALAAATRCLHAGVAMGRLYQTLYQNDRPERLVLRGRALSAMRLHCGGQVALMSITADDFAETGAQPEETEDLVNEPLRVAGVSVSVLLTQQGEVIRGSIRSKSHHPCAAGGEPVDVAALARTLGGGGHARAAGFRMTGTIDQVAQEVLAMLAAELGQSPTDLP